MALEAELKTYEQRLPELLAHRGKFVLINGNEIAGFYAAYEDAVREGYDKFQLRPFLVKQIQSSEQVQYVSRIAHCHISPGP